MNWNLRKPDVRLNVRPVREWDARVKPELTAGLSPAARAVHRARRERECAKIPVSTLIEGTIPLKTIIAFLCSFLFLVQAHAADLAIPTITEVSPAVAPKCLNDGTTTIAVGSTDGTYLYGTASYEGWVCRLKVHSGRGPGIVKLSGCAEVVWSAVTGDVVSITSQGTSCPQ